MRVQFIQSWRNYRRDQIIEPPDGQAREMIRRGIVKELAVASPVIKKPSKK